MDEVDECCLLTSSLVLSYLAYKRVRKPNRRRWWVRPLYQERRRSGFFETTFKHIKEHDSELFFKATRMSIAQYKLLLQLICPHLEKKSLRKAIEPECRVVLTLIYLSQGVSREFLAWTFRMGVSTVRKIIIEVSTVLWNILSPVYMTQLNTSDWVKIASEFNEKWQMPNCIGSIDGKHIKIKCPPKSGSQFFNYKGHFSIVLLGICDANYTFSAVDVGAYGSQSDGGIFRNSTIGGRILRNELNVPPPTNLPNSQEVIPHIFVGDSAFPLLCNLMRPYPGILLSKEREIFNYRLSRARRIIENTFGILSNRWRVLINTIEFHPKNADKIVLACVILHNFLKITDELYGAAYCPPTYCDSYNANCEVVPGQWREANLALESVRRFGSNNSSRQAFTIRETLTKYFMNEGKVPFQP